MNRYRYIDRWDAGETLAEQLQEYRGQNGLLVLGLPRGGVPVAAVVARELGAELDILVVRKIGVPSHSEVAMGAIASIAGSVETVENADVLDQLRRVGWTDTFADVAANELIELKRRQEAYRAGRSALQLANRVVILVDDGLATGATMRAAVAATRKKNPARIVVATPVGSSDTCAGMRDIADDVVCTWIPDAFYAVGQAYVNFDQTSDDEVRNILGTTEPGAPESGR